MFAFVDTDFIVVVSFLFFFIGILLRLTDSSASVFLKNKIFVESSYVSKSTIRTYLKKTKDGCAFKKSLKRLLLWRKLHDFFMMFFAVFFLLAVIKSIVPLTN